MPACSKLKPLRALKELSPKITLLTQRQRLEAALLLKTKRDEVQKAWVPAPDAPVAPATQPVATPAPKPTGFRAPASTAPVAEIRGSS